MFTYLLMLFLTVSIFPQQNATYFSSALDQHLKNYIASCQRAVMWEDFDLLTVMFDSLVDSRLKGTLVDPYKLNRLEGGHFHLDSLKRPVLLNTTTSWYIKNQEEVQAINTLASEFRGKIDVVILYWDNRKTVKKAASEFSKDVIVTYIDEAANMHNEIITYYKHALGVPASFYISSHGEIIEINRGALAKYSPVMDAELYASNYKLFQQQIMKLLLSDELSGNTILTTTD